jgi:hypothetical protein
MQMDEHANMTFMIFIFIDEASLFTFISNFVQPFLVRCSSYL